MAFKRSWCTNETVQVNVTLPLTSLGRLAALKEEAATRLKATIKQNPALYSFLQRMRAKNGNAPVDIENSAED
jgi:CelD/BcsL family acetyltransferase involved in cellulose biosynthesis